MSTQAEIRELLERRRVIWNSRDPEGYRAILTDDVEIVSATGRASRGIEEALRLYIEQGREPSYCDAMIEATLVRHIRVLDDECAEVLAAYRMTGVRIPAGTQPRAISGELTFAVRKEHGRWKIAGVYARPPS